MMVKFIFLNTVLEVEIILVKFSLEEIMVGKILLGAEENILDQKLEIQHLKKNITNQ